MAYAHFEVLTLTEHYLITIPTISKKALEGQ